ncbi:MAG TPA: M15 family metallopeptidase [Acidimicrobiales bacterium]|nr:M15 family metallopeptidase [Acidimicrobiales bacterium]
MLIRLTAIIGVSCALLTPDATGAEEPDEPRPEETRRQLDEVREQRGRAALDVDALAAEDAEVQAAIATLEENVATQRAELDEAERALAAAEAEVDTAAANVAAEQQRIDSLNELTDDLVVEAFMNPPSDDVLDPFKADSLSDTTVKQALVGLQSSADADLLDQLEQAHEDLEVEQADKEVLAAEAEDKRAAAAAALSDVENALAQQEEFAADVEARLDAKLAEVESLRTLDAELAERLEREQAEVAARLLAAQQAAEAQRAAEQRAAEQRAAEQRAAEQRAAQASAPAPSPAPTSSGGGGGGGGAPRSAVQPVAGGLATVSCPYGGSITVAGSIAGNVQALLDASAAQGVSLCGSGYRDPQRQIELRRQHCGTSYYAIYQMSPSLCSPPTARPGTSLHERGLAIDFSCNGGGAIRHGNSCWNFLAANAASYGLYNLPSEPWHWSTTGR